ncbi:reverse transcriptase-like protein [Candidatus Nomurabacteria bacterium]|nr:reverse transcriptase-like protein [Candidatus Kaiserbacteria bacterium]MCB9814604.1 reverse transcriptase-like protein [Candidatus Nomurabacteria bacterium]
MGKITVYTKGVSQGDPGPATIGAYIVDEKNNVVKEVSENIGNATDNFAEYMAVLRGLQTVVDLYKEKAKDIEFEFKLSSEFVKKQLVGDSPIIDPGLVPYFIEIHNMQITNALTVTYTLVSKKKNIEANRLVKEAVNI